VSTRKRKSPEHYLSSEMGVEWFCRTRIEAGDELYSRGQVRKTFPLPAAVHGLGREIVDRLKQLGIDATYSPAIGEPEADCMSGNVRTIQITLGPELREASQKLAREHLTASKAARVNGAS
jgi:hypothetical protein